MHVPNVTVRSQPRWQYPEIESDGRLALDALLSGESHPIVRSGDVGYVVRFPIVLEASYPASAV